MANAILNIHDSDVDFANLVSSKVFEVIDKSYIEGKTSAKFKVKKSPHSIELTVVIIAAAYPMIKDLVGYIKREKEKREKGGKTQGPQINVSITIQQIENINLDVNIPDEKFSF